MVNVIKSISKAFGKLSGNTLNPDEVISHKASEDIAEEKSSAQKDIEAKLLQMAIDYLQDSTRCKAEVVRRCLATSAYYKGYKNAPEIATMHSNDGYIADNEGRIIKKNTNYMIRASQLIVARTLAVNPDCYVAPSTSWEVDIEAARAGRQIIQHVSKVNNIRGIKEEMVISGNFTTTVYLQTLWDSKANCSTVYVDPADGQLHRKVIEGGDVRFRTVKFGDAFPDHSAGRNIHDGRYFIVRHVLPVSQINRMYGVNVEIGEGMSLGVDDHKKLMRISGTADMSFEKDSAAIFEIYLKPVPGIFEQGAWALFTDRRIVKIIEWPNRFPDGRIDCEEFPFDAYGYAMDPDSPWYHSLAETIIDIINSIHLAESKIATRVANDKDNILYDTNIDIDTDELDKYESQRIPVALDEGQRLQDAIEVVKTTTNYTQLIEWHKYLVKLLEYLTGTMDLVGENGIASNVSSLSFDAAGETMQNQQTPHTNHLEQCWAGAYRKAIARYAQHAANIDRLLAIDDQNVPQDMKAMKPGRVPVKLQALKEGQTELIIVPSSALYKSPAAKEEKLNELMKVLAQLKDQPELIELYLNQCQFIRSDENLDRMIAEIKAVRVAQGTPQQIAQMKAQASIQAIQTQQSMQLQMAMKMAGIDVYKQASILSYKALSEKIIAEARAAQQISFIQAQQQHPNISYSFTGKLDSQAVESAERQQGWETGGGKPQEQPVSAPPLKVPPSRSTPKLKKAV